MSFSEMLRRVTLIKTDVSDELSASIIRVTKIGEIGTKSICCWLRLTLFLVHRFLSSDDGGVNFLRNIGFYKSHTA
jgi:hypothetical protein